MKKLQHKLYWSFGIIISLMIFISGIALWSNKQIVIELKNKQEDYRIMLDATEAAHDINRYAKSAESHLILYLDLNEKLAFDRYNQDIKSLQNKIIILLTRKYDPIGQGLINEINLQLEKLLSDGRLLLTLKEQGEIPQDSFFTHNREIILAFHDATSV